jgi:adenine-specific DNA-methyltransferase
MSIELPEPLRGDKPTTYADRLGRWYSKRVSIDHKKRFGQFFTPEPVAHYMANLLQPREDMFRLLDPGSGTGILACAAAESLILRDKAPKRLEVEVYENDPELVPILEKSLSFLKDFLADRGITCLITLKTNDFVLTDGEALSDQLADTPLLFSKEPKTPNFDIVICNPPYFKIKKSDPRSVVASSVVHGQPNLYGLFMAVSAAILNPTGELVFITPRSFTSGPYFSLFRERFFERMKPERIHIFNSRTDAFKRDEILQRMLSLKRAG